VLINDATTLTLGAIRHEADESGIPIVLGIEPARLSECWPAVCVA
jgi:hypothetical protein